MTLGAKALGIYSRGGRVRQRHNDMTDNSMLVAAVDLDTKRKAQVTVATHSTSVEDCARLLDMLGIAGVE